MMTVEPPDVHPSLGLMAFMQGVATGKGGYKPWKSENAGTSILTFIMYATRLVLQTNEIKREQ